MVRKVPQLKNLSPKHKNSKSIPTGDNTFLHPHLQPSSKIMSDRPEATPLDLCLLFTRAEYSCTAHPHDDHTHDKFYRKLQLVISIELAAMIAEEKLPKGKLQDLEPLTKFTLQMDDKGLESYPLVNYGDILRKAAETTLPEVKYWFEGDREFLKLMKWAHDLGGKIPRT
jgi:hypothetical protein